MNQNATLLHFYPNELQKVFYSQVNVDFLWCRIHEMIDQLFGSRVIIVSKEDIVRVMGRIYKEKIENIVRMNNRVIMFIVQDVQHHHSEAKKYMNFSENFVDGQKLIDMSSGKGVDTKGIKNFTKFGTTNFGFYFTN
jgi:hypothetical protein